MNSPKILHYKAEKFTKIRIKTNILLKKTVNKFLLIFLFLGISWIRLVTWIRVRGRWRTGLIIKTQ